VAVITITGDPGSGKTTVAKRLAKLLNCRYHYTGGVMREIASERGLTIEEFYEQLKNEPELEKEIDERQKALMNKYSHMIAEGRMAFFLSSCFKKINVFLKVDEFEGAKRQRQRPENQNKKIIQIVEETRRRVKNERKRYEELYGIKDHHDEKHFNVVINTTNSTPDEVLDDLMECLKALL